jgi:hypothetical protein
MVLERLDAGEARSDALPSRASPRAEIAAANVGRELVRALRAWEQLTPNEAARALRAVEELRRIRSRIHRFAQRLGYTRACEDALPYCMGECCKHHFPRDIKRADAFVAVCGLAGEEARSLSARIVSAGERWAGCPLLDEHGCMLSFQDRPIVCASAYPCFATREYWEFLQTEKPRIDALYATLQTLLEV